MTLHTHTATDGFPREDHNTSSSSWPLSSSVYCCVIRSRPASVSCGLSRLFRMTVVPSQYPRHVLGADSWFKLRMIEKVTVA
jgi:hypothetical protein